MKVMTTPYFHQSVIEKFKAFIIKETNGKPRDFFDSSFMVEEEKYKEELAQSLRPKINELFSGGRNASSAKVVLSTMKQFLSGFTENLVDWRTIPSAIDKLTKDIEAENEASADIFRSLFCDDDDETTFYRLTEYFGRIFDLVAYFFFLKNPKKYVPIKARIFDTIFAEYSIEMPKLSKHADWKTYNTFVGVVKEVQEELRSIFTNIDISLLDAHSFLWILSEEKYKNFDETNLETDTVTTQLREKERTIVAKARNGQGKYRDDLITYWGGACSVTGCKLTDILVASHIKPWKDSDTRECRDYFNGLLLIPNLDKLFDMGYISFADSGKIIISARLGKDDCAKLGINANMQIPNLKPEHKVYLQYHRSEIFDK